MVLNAWMTGAAGIPWWSVLTEGCITFFLPMLFIVNQDAPQSSKGSKGIYVSWLALCLWFIFGVRVVRYLNTDILLFPIVSLFIILCFLAFSLWKVFVDMYDMKEEFIKARGEWRQKVGVQDDAITKSIADIVVKGTDSIADIVVKETDKINDKYNALTFRVKELENELKQNSNLLILIDRYECRYRLLTKPLEEVDFFNEAKNKNILSVLRDHGILTLADLCRMEPQTFFNMRGIGRKKMKVFEYLTDSLQLDFCMGDEIDRITRIHQFIQSLTGGKGGENG